MDTVCKEPGWLGRYSDWLLAGRPGFDSRQRQDIFIYFTTSRPALGPMSYERKSTCRRSVLPRTSCLQIQSLQRSTHTVPLNIIDFWVVTPRNSENLRTTRRHAPRDPTVHSHRCEDLSPAQELPWCVPVRQMKGVVRVSDEGCDAMLNGVQCSAYCAPPTNIAYGV
jgi:hypothetical protein